MAPASDNLRSRLIGLLQARSVKRGEFTLASGRTSSYYVDARLTTMSAEGLEVIGQLALNWIRDAGWAPNSVGGLTLGADPVAYSIALASRGSPPRIDAFTVRKAKKEHGAGRSIEGCFAAPSDVVIVEDVITTGQSALKAIAAVEGAGGSVLGVLAVVDRVEGGVGVIESAGYRVAVLVDVAELGVELGTD